MGPARPEALYTHAPPQKFCPNLSPHPTAYSRPLPSHSSYLTFLPPVPPLSPLPPFPPKALAHAVVWGSNTLALSARKATLEYAACEWVAAALVGLQCSGPLPQPPQHSQGC